MSAPSDPPAWPHRSHTLTWRRPAPGTVRVPHGYRWTWTGCAVMGVLNVTPDSFSDGGAFVAPGLGSGRPQPVDVDAAVAAGRRLWSAGAVIVDVGGASTRPGAAPVPAEVEEARVVPVVRGLRTAEPHALLSIDTSDPGVAEAALQAGADLVNDVRTLRDRALRRVCEEAGVPAIASHLRGEPATMQRAPSFQDVVEEVLAELATARGEALADGVPDVMLDPGIGFGKTGAHHRALVLATGRLAALGAPLLVGASRKGFLGEITGVVEASRRDAASIALHLAAAVRGAAMVRVHDVAGHVQALRVQGWLDG
jgi:dihydropteroate synthase